MLETNLYLILTRKFVKIDVWSYQQYCSEVKQTKLTPPKMILNPFVFMCL